MHPTHLPFKKSTMKLYFLSLKNGKHSMSASRNSCFKLSSAQIRLAANHRAIQCFFPKRFLPTPVPISLSDNGLKIDPKEGWFRSLFQSFCLASTWKLDTNYHEYCPSLQESNAKNKRVIDRRMCKNCSLYHSTIAAMKKHKRVCQSKQQKDCLAEDLSLEESDVEDDAWGIYDELTVVDG